jgi:gas vesicle protein
MNYERGANVGLYFLLGGVAGAALALLFTPRTGEEMRQLIGDRARDGQDLANRAISRGKELAQQAATTLRRRASDAASEYQSGVSGHDGSERREQV